MMKYGYHFDGAFMHCTDAEKVMFFFLIIGSMLFTFATVKYETDWLLFKQRIRYYFKNKKRVK